MNFSFREKGKTILSTEINWDVVDEMRKERKIMIILRDIGVDEYIAMAMPEINLYDSESHKELPNDLKLAIEEKLLWRSEFAARVCITRLDYMIRVMRIVWEGKHQISNPDSFSDKIRRVERRDAKKAAEGELLRLGTSSSFGSSMYSKSQKTGISTGSSDAGTNDGGENADDMETTTVGINSDPIIVGVRGTFDQAVEQIKDDGTARIAYLKRTFKNTK